MKTKIHWMLCLVLLLSLSATTTPAAALACNPTFVTQVGAVITVKPTSIDDTANLQCAFDLAVATGPGQTVRLLKGTYHIGMIFVNDFEGTFTGVSAKDTVVTNLPNLYVTPEDAIFAPPSPTNVWPDLVSFVDSDFTLANMAFHIVGEFPTQEWTIFDITPGFTQLSAAVLIMGGEANATIKGVRVEGTPFPNLWLGVNLINGIYYEPYYGSPYLLTGSFTIQDSSFKHIGAATAFEAPYETPILITRNTYEDTFLAMDAADPYHIQFEFSQNKVNAEIGLDIYFAYSPSGAMDVGSQYLIRNNVFSGTYGILVEQPFGEGIDCLLRGNNVDNVTDIGILLGPGSKGCTVIGDTETNVVDLGTDNVLVGVNNMGTGVGPIIHSFKGFLR